VPASIGIALHAACAPSRNMNAPDVQVNQICFKGPHRLPPRPSPQGVRTMNPSQCIQPEQLFGACMHAGGWPKLGWAAQDAVEEELTCYDEHNIWL